MTQIFSWLALRCVAAAPHVGRACRRAISCRGVPPCLAPLFSSVLRETNTECYKGGQNSLFLYPSREIHETTRNQYETSHETTRILSTNSRNHHSIKKRFLIHTNNIYRIQRFRGKCDKHRVVSCLVSWWFRGVSMWIDWAQNCADLSMSTLYPPVRETRKELVKVGSVLLLVLADVWENA